MRLVVGMLALMSSGCPATGAPVRQPASATPPPAPDQAILAVSPSQQRSCRLPELAPALPSALANKRRDAIRALDAGRHAHGKKLLDAILDTHPGNAATAALADGAFAALSASQGAAARAILKVAPVVVAHPPMAHEVRSAVSGVERGPVPKLGGMRMKANKVIDTEAWLKEHDLSLPDVPVRPADLPQEIPDRLGPHRLMKVIDHGDHRVLVFGHHLVAVVEAKGRVLRVLDVASFLNLGGAAQQVRWAQAHDGVLYLSNANMGYATASHGFNAFLTAIDLRTGKLKWRSKPLVANGRNFLLYGGYILSGYGFTAESDYLYVLARDTGAVAHRLSLPTKPDLLLTKGDRLHVRGYDKDFVFDLPALGQPSRSVAGRTEPSDVVLSVEALSQPLEPTAEDRCRVERAVLLLDHAGDGPTRLDEARSALWKLSRSYKESHAVGALRAIIEEAQSGDRWLLQGEVITPPAPPAKRASGSAAHPALPAAARPRLVRRSSKRNGITDRRVWLEKVAGKHPARPATLADANSRFGSRAFPGRPLSGAPKMFGRAKLSMALEHPDHAALIYGGRFVAIVEEGRPSTLLDLQNFVAPARVRDREWARFATQEVNWAERADGVLYVCNGGGSYAKEVYGLKGFVSALDAKTGALIWRSEPLVCNANFVLRGRYLLTGYGFTAEPDNLVVIDRTTGETTQKLPLASAPDLLVLDGDTLHVRTYDTDYVFDVK
jgi:hypothetical protein